MTTIRSRRAPKTQARTRRAKDTAPQIPPVLAMIVRAATASRHIPRALPIACEMMPAILASCSEGDPEVLGETSIHDAIEKADEAFRTWSRDEDSLHAWHDTIERVSDALDGAGIEPEDVISQFRTFFGEDGFCVGVAFAYYVLRCSDGGKQ